ncbi:thiamine pyrophosphate-binding protein [Roseicyclus mahoneyensis]|uniref:Acetolactate synthase-1/2/3 large subunit n=1 Tax=Roseicyclus mahoneyensis TaxID=164332 RepID=A0A316GZS4_9RHOB|nr:thiamine pyrophosphate-binding protein [Roseicyclus mahoneyensis]PWK60639.1 acetolactate synthase-1/2/3 large subunit [Roseicyclus mahoneyensis]
MTNEAARSGADIIGAALARAGATHAFGIPGGEVLALMQGLDGAGIGFVLVKHENGGGFMAEGLWHMTGALPVLVATLGPGVANAVNVVANAMQDRVPLIFLTGCVDADLAETYTHQVFDHQAMLRPVVKGSFRLAHGAIGAGMAKAIALATSGQPGPVHVDVPIGVAEAVTREAEAPAPQVFSPGLPPQAALDAARAALAGAQRPIAIAGVDAVNEGADAAVAAFCRDHAIPLVTTYKGKGLMPEGDPLCLGGAGLSPKADRILMPLMDQADCIVLLGYDPIEMRVGWRSPWTHGQTVIEVAPVRRDHGMHSADHLLLGGLAETLPALAHDAPPRWTGGAPATARAALAQAFAVPDHWGPHQVFATLRAVMPADTIATADSGAHRILFSQMWDCPTPRGMLQSSGLCTMACAVPLAAGAKLGRPDAPLLAVVGDAGLEMGAGELATLSALRLPVVICVLVDDSLALIELKQRGTQRPNLGVDFGGPGAGTDFAALARAFGGHGVEVSDSATLAQEAGAALTRDRFTLIAARIPRRAYDGAF